MIDDIPQMEPGGLIRADDFNALVLKMRNIDDRLKVVEGGLPSGTAVFIDDVFPPLPFEGDDVQITGRNFQMSTGATKIEFNGFPPPFIAPNSSDTKLLCRVPDIPGLSTGGSPVALTVRNASTAYTKQILVRKKIVQTSGVVDVIWDGVDPAVITAGQDNLVQMHVKSRLSQNTTVTLTATPNPAAWPVAFLNDAKAVMAAPQIPLVPDEEKTFYVRVQIPTGTNGQALDLTVDGSGANFSPTTTGLLSFVVGQAPNVDTSITPAVVGSIPVGAVVGLNVTCPVGVATPTQINLATGFSQPGNYQVTFTKIGTMTGWTLAILEPPPEADGRQMIRLVAADIPAGGTKSVAIQLRLLVTASAAASGQARLTIQKEGATTSRQMTFNVQKASS
jgi:hypothetical protein